MCFTLAHSQVGIGTTSPDPSSILDISSDSQGFLAPRMTTAQRLAITNPADGLMVFDTDLGSFLYFNDTLSNWGEIKASTNGRVNYKLIQSEVDLASELAAGGGAKYSLDENVLYEINGVISLNYPIALNDAYIMGRDSGEDMLIASGDVFQCSKGGVIKNLMLRSTGGKVFNFQGSGAEVLMVRDCIIDGSSEVGIIKDYYMYFSSLVLFSANSNGIIYENINELLLENQGWYGSNSGIYETYTGTFGNIQQDGGFFVANGSTIGLDVSSNPTVNSGIISGAVFSGNSSTYVQGYTAGSYSGYNFSNAWTVNCPGIPEESDAVATGDINMDYAEGSGATTNFTNNSETKKIVGTTTSNNLFRFSRNGNNKIEYLGEESRYFQVNASLSFKPTATSTYIVYIAKNGVVESETKVYGRATSSWFSPASLIALPITGTLLLDKNDEISVYVRRSEGSGSLKTLSLNLSIR